MQKMLFVVITIFFCITIHSYNDENEIKELNEMEQIINNKKKIMEIKIQELEKKTKNESLTNSQKEMIKKQMEDLKSLIDLLDDCNKKIDRIKKNDQKITKYQKTYLLCLVSIMEGNWEGSKEKHENNMKEIFKDLYDHHMILFDILNALWIYTHTQIN